MTPPRPPLSTTPRERLLNTALLVVGVVAVVLVGWLWFVRLHEGDGPERPKRFQIYRSPDANEFS